MIVTVDTPRVLHLFLLLGVTYLGGRILIDRFDWSGLSAFGLSCTVACQLSNAIMQLYAGNERDESGQEGNAKNKKLRTGNPKKKSKRHAD